MQGWMRTHFILGGKSAGPGAPSHFKAPFWMYQSVSENILP